jgi:transcriptional regulator with XRE-family HTH domain
MRRLDPTRDDAGIRLRTLRLRRGMSQVALADLACISPAFVSMIETGQRPLRRGSDILALADVLKVSPRYLADGWEDSPALGRHHQTAPLPARCDPITLDRHQQLARQYTALLASGDARAAGDWLRRLARESTVNPWLLIDQFAALQPESRSTIPPREHDACDS